MEHVFPRGVLDRPEAMRVFASQFGVATIGQLVAVGIPQRAIGRARQRGVLTSVLPGVVELGDFPPTFRQRAMAAQLFGGRRQLPRRGHRRSLLRAAGNADPAGRTGDEQAAAGRATRLAAGDVQHLDRPDRCRRARGRLAHRRAAEDAPRPGWAARTMSSSSAPPRMPGTCVWSRRPRPPSTSIGSLRAVGTGSARMRRWLERRCRTVTPGAERPGDQGRPRRDRCRPAGASTAASR